MNNRNLSQSSNYEIQSTPFNTDIHNGPCLHIIIMLFLFPWLFFTGSRILQLYHIEIDTQ